MVAAAVADRLTASDSAMICHSSGLANASARVAKSLTEHPSRLSEYG
jgi:hypothetical protein